MTMKLSVKSHALPARNMTALIALGKLYSAWSVIRQQQRSCGEKWSMAWKLMQDEGHCMGAAIDGYRWLLPRRDAKVRSGAAVESE